MDNQGAMFGAFPYCQVGRKSPVSILIFLNLALKVYGTERYAVTRSIDIVSGNSGIRDLQNFLENTNHRSLCVFAPVITEICTASVAGKAELTHFVLRYTPTFVGNYAIFSLFEGG